jgi:hypothetical protein
MKRIVYLLPLVAVGCVIPGTSTEVTPESVGAGVDVIENVVSLFNPLLGTGIGALGGGIVALMKHKGQKKIVSALEGAMDSMDDKETEMIKTKLMAAMDHDTKHLVKKLKGKL